MILGGKLPGKVGRCRFLWLHGQAVKTPPFHGGNPGSIPGGVTKTGKPCQAARLSFFMPKLYACMAELADAPDLGSGG